MKGSVFKRCVRCNARLNERRCDRCGSDQFSWAFVVDVWEDPRGQASAACEAGVLDEEGGGARP